MMIGCQMDSLDGDPSQHQLQACPFAQHHSGTPTTPISPIFGGASCDPQEQQQMQPPQLLRSKSLNDISNDSQIAAFASDRFINLHQNQNANQNNTSSQITNGDINVMGVAHNNYPYVGINTQLNSLDHPQQSQQHQQNILHQAMATAQCVTMQPPFNIYANNSSQQQITRNLNDNQCSNSGSNISKPLDAGSAAMSTNQAATVFDICNPMLVNLNGVTEQIGNLRL